MTRPTSSCFIGAWGTQQARFNSTPSLWHTTGGGDTCKDFLSSLFGTLRAGPWGPFGNRIDRIYLFDCRTPRRARVRLYVRISMSLFPARLVSSRRAPSLTSPASDVLSSLGHTVYPRVTSYSSSRPCEPMELLNCARMGGSGLSAARVRELVGATRVRVHADCDLRVVHAHTAHAHASSGRRRKLRGSR